MLRHIEVILYVLITVDKILNYVSVLVNIVQSLKWKSILLDNNFGNLIVSFKESFGIKHHFLKPELNTSSQAALLNHSELKTNFIGNGSEDIFF